MTTLLLHGFWGQPADWNSVIARLPLSTQLVAPDLYAEGPLAPTTEYARWGERFWQWTDHVLGPATQVQIIGYSMGARLALNAVMHAPHRVSRALLLSGSSLPIPEPQARETWERDWAERFRTLTWPALATQWQRQDVFAGSSALARRESPALRELLALSLLNWSPRHHRFTPGDLAALPASIHWAFGALDQKYAGVAKTLQELPVRGQISLIPGAGHRLLIEAADFVGAWIAGV